MSEENKNLPAVQPTPMELMKLAVEQDADVDKLEKLMDLQDRYESGVAKKAFIEAMFRFHENPPTITKNKPVYGKKRSDGPQYHFADFSDIVKVVRPALRAVDIVATWSSKPLGQGVQEVTCILRHKLGHEESASMSGAPEAGGSKNAIQGSGSTDSYLRKYTFMSVCGLVAEGEDNDGRGGDAHDGPITEAMVSQIQKEAEDRNVSLMEFCERLGVADVPSILISEFAGAMKFMKLRPKASQ